MIISGYASLFGVKDLAGDITVEGCFAQAIRNYAPDEIRMLYQHDQSRPIGKWLNIYEDHIGLFCEGELDNTIPDGKLAIALINSKQMDGLSIGFRTLEFKSIQSETNGRLLEVLDLREISLVGFPMLPRARITKVIK